MLLVLQSLQLCSSLFPVSLRSAFLCQRIPSYIPTFLRNAQVEPTLSWSQLLSFFILQVA